MHCAPMKVGLPYTTKVPGGTDRKISIQMEGNISLWSLSSLGGRLKKINATSGQYFLMSLLWLIVATTSNATELNYLNDTTTHPKIDLVRPGEHLWRSISTSRGKVWDKSFISERGMSVICGQRVSRYVGPWHAKSVSALGCRPA